MALYPPALDQLTAAAARRGLAITTAEAQQLLKLGEELLRGAERLAATPGFTLQTCHPRTPGALPRPEENPYNAWAWRCDVAGPASQDPTLLLAGRRIALKDIIPVAGMPLTAGSALLQGHVPTFDATVTRRILDNGGRIVGIGTTEDLCLSGASVSAASGQVRNPRDPLRSAGGSSSGLAALIAAGEIHSGMGADQGGSIRIPASLCGIYGLKPTYGLVPYTGVVPIDVSIDHVGPMAARIEELARLLQAVAGFDEGLDPRQRADVDSADYLAAIAGPRLEGVRIGVLSEGFAGELGEGIRETVLAAVARLEELGAVAAPVEVPLHALAMDMHGALLLQGASEFMIRGNGMGTAGKGFYDEGIGQAAAAGMALHGDQLFASVKYAITMGGYLWDAYGGAYYAKAQNLAIALRRAYDAAFAEFDVIVMPTTRTRAPLLPAEGAPGLEAVELALAPTLIANTCAFNHTGHPALSVPLGRAGELPVGMMLVGPWYGEAGLLRIAAALEEADEVYPQG